MDVRLSQKRIDAFCIFVIRDPIEDYQTLLQRCEPRNLVVRKLVELFLLFHSIPLNNTRKPDPIADVRQDPYQSPLARSSVTDYYFFFGSSNTTIPILMRGR